MKNEPYTECIGCHRHIEITLDEEHIYHDLDTHHGVKTYHAWCSDCHMDYTIKTSEIWRDGGDEDGEDE